MQHMNNRVRTTRRADAEAGVALSKRRRWFTDDPNGGQAAGAGAGSNGGSSAGTENTGHMIPKSRFDDVNGKYQALLEQQQKDKEAAQAAEQERLQKQGEFQQLYDTEKKRAADLAGKAARAEQLDKVIGESNAKRIAQLPEAMRTLVPSALPPEQVAAYLDANWTLLQGAAAPNLDGGAGGDSGIATTPLTQEEKNAMQGSGMTEAEWRAAKQKAAQGG